MTRDVAESFDQCQNLNVEWELNVFFFFVFFLMKKLLLLLLLEVEGLR